MAEYRAPIADISHALTKVAGLDHVLGQELFSHVDTDTVLGVPKKLDDSCQK